MCRLRSGNDSPMEKEVVWDLNNNEGEKISVPKERRVRDCKSNENRQKERVKNILRRIYRR